MNVQRIPEWLRVKLSDGHGMNYTKGVISQFSLNTVCEEANCPNKIECFGRKTATFMVLGSSCTRNCRFCNVNFGKPDTVDDEEPENLAKAVSKLGLEHAVITSVTRDDLADGGAAHFARVVEWIRKLSPHTTAEVLIPDFKGSIGALKTVADSVPDVIAHNVETVPRLYGSVCPQSNYKTSLEVLKNIKLLNPTIKSKAGIMVGLGETKEEMLKVFADLREVGCEILTIGQYLAPSKQHHPIIKYIHPDVFEEYKRIALDMGFSHVSSGPFFRSSYHAGEALKA
ncbi:MAG TPA: lipoyl synthase [Clostridiaceae bacterium]